MVANYSAGHRAVAGLAEPTARPSRRSRVVLRILWGAAAATVVLSGCSSTTSGNPLLSSSPSNETFSATPAQPTSPAPGGSTPAPGSSAAPLRQGQAQAALLTASEVGSQFTEGTYAATDKPLPCAAAGSPPFRLQVTPQAFAGKRLDHASPPATLNETIYVFADASAARRALSVGKDGFNCSTGTIYSADGNAAPITIGQATDLSSDLPVDAGYAWVVQNKDVQGAQLAFVTGAVLVTLVLITGAGTDTSAFPNGLAVAKLAIAKIKNS